MYYENKIKNGKKKTQNENQKEYQEKNKVQKNVENQESIRGIKKI